MKNAIVTVIATLAVAAITQVRAETRVLVRDDFEGGIRMRPTVDPAGRGTGFQFDAEAPRLRAMLSVGDPSGPAGARLEEGIAATGSKSLLLVDSASGKNDFMPALTWWLYGDQQITRGRLVIEFDLFVPGEGGAQVEINTRDYSDRRSERRRPYQAHFSMKVADGRVYVGQHRDSWVADRWSRVRIEVPVGTDQNLLHVTLDGREEVVPLEQPVHAVTMISLFMPGKLDGRIYIDNLAMTVDE